MKVGSVLSFSEYWTRPQYSSKRPNMAAENAVSRRGDNIYQPLLAIGEFRQLPSRHSQSDGSENVESKRVDLGGLHVLAGDAFVYFGRQGPELPPELTFLRAGRGHRCRFPEEQIVRVERWFESLPRGVYGPPTRWPAGDGSWQRV